MGLVKNLQRLIGKGCLQVKGCKCDTFKVERVRLGPACACLNAGRIRKPWFSMDIKALVRKKEETHVRHMWLLGSSESLVYKRHKLNVGYALQIRRLKKIHKHIKNKRVTRERGCPLQ